MNVYRVTMMSGLLALGLAWTFTVWAGDEDHSVSLSLPPASLAQWYRPAHERDRWLHTMFRLRREMQAISEYAALDKPELLKKWLMALQKDYRAIGEMVPEWADELETDLIVQMLALAEQGKLNEVVQKQRRLAKSCQSCHREYKLSTALMYRTPNFSAVKVEDGETMEEEDYSAVMKRLTLLLNRVKIASSDGRQQAARGALEQLQSRLADLGESCSACHKQDDSRTTILGDASIKALQQVQVGLEQGDNQAVGRHLGKFAVEVCAACHAIHRFQSDLRKLMHNH